MSKISRVAGNLLAFAINATGTNRTIFGDVTQSDTLDANVNADYRLGWEIVTPSEAPTKEDFNGLGFTLGQLLAYLHQVGVPEWQTDQEFHTDSFTNRNGILYVSKTDTNTGNDPETDAGVNWEYAGPGMSGNGLYNGLCLINQEAVTVLDAAGVSATNDTWPIDMHKTTLAGVTGTHQWLSTSQPTGVNGNSLKYAATSTASGQIGSRQIVENFANRAGRTHTESRWVKSNSSDARVVLDDGVTKTAGTAHTGGGGWELLTVTATIDASPTKLECHAVIASAALANVSITSGDYIEFTDARLDFGSRRLAGNREDEVELALCQRFYYIVKSLANAVGGTFSGSSGGAAGGFILPVPMRATPAMTLTSLRLSLGSGTSFNVTGGSVGDFNQNIVHVSFTAVGTTTGVSYYLRAQSALTGSIEFSARL